MTTCDDELLARVREMRERGSAPKQIAKALGLRPAQATVERNRGKGNYDYIAHL